MIVNQFEWPMKLMLLAVGLVLTALGWWWLQPAGAQAAPNGVLIQTVQTDLGTGELTIGGTGFDQKSDTRVFLGGTQLTITSENPNQIVATLPAETKPGSYLLEVFVGQSAGTIKTDEFDLTITNDEALQAESDDLQSQVDDLTTLLAGVTRVIDPTTGADTLVFESMNLQVVNGTGTTESTNAAGNLIIGYNEDSGSDDKSGSHNLVIGDNHTYTSYEGIIAGYQHAATARRSVVLGGAGNFVSYEDAAIVGGFSNTASHEGSAVVGGQGNTAGAVMTVVAGGQNNTALESNTFVGGGLGGTTP